MHTIYGKTAVLSAKELQKNKNADPREVWSKSVKQFTDSNESQKKGCPQTTFLYLCSEGHIKDFKTATKLVEGNSANCIYVKQMMEYIAKKKGVISKKKELWDSVHPSNKPGSINGQPDVIYALLKENLLNY